MAVALTIISKFDDRGVRKAQRSIANVGSSARGFSGIVGADFVRAGTSLQRFGDRVTQTGKTLTTGITLPVVAMGAFAVHESTKFESAFTGVQKTVNATTGELAQLRQGIRTMATEIPSTREEIAGVAESAGQLGIKTKSILGFTRTMIDLGQATNLASDEAATSFARFANIVKMPQTQFNRLGSTVVALGNNMATTESEIVAMGMRIAGAGAQVGMSESQIMALAASLSSVGISAESGGTAVSKTMIGIEAAVQKGGRALKLWAETAGMSAKQFSTAWRRDSAQALNAVVRGLASMEKQGGSTLGQLEKLGITEVRQRDALLRAAGAGDLLTQALKISGQAWDENTALTKEAAQRYKTTESRLAILKNKVTDVAVSVGESLTPALTDVAGVVVSVASRFDNLPPGLQDIAVKAALAAAAIGPLMIVLGQVAKLGGGVISGIGNIRIAFSSMSAAAPLWARGIANVTQTIGALGTAVRVGGAAGGVTGSISALGSTLAAALGPAGIVVGAVAGAAALTYGISKLGSKLDGTADRVNQMKAAVSALESDTSGKLQAWADKELGGHLVSTKGTITWKPSIKTEIKRKATSGLVKWTEQEAAKEAAAIREKWAEAKLAEAEGAQAYFEQQAQILSSQISARGGSSAVKSAEYRNLIAQAETYGAQVDKLKGNLESVTGRNWRIQLSAHDADLTRTINQKTKELRKLQKADYSPQIAARTARIESQLTRLKRQRAEFRSNHWEGLVLLKTEKAKSRLQNINDALEQARKDAKKGVDVGATIEQLLKKKAQAKAELQKLQAQKTEPKVGLNDQATTKAHNLRLNLTSIFSQPITQTVRVQKVGADGKPQARGGVYSLTTATSFVAGEAGREIAAFFPMNNPTRAASVFASLQSQLFGNLPTAQTRASSAPQAVSSASSSAAGKTVVEAHEHYHIHLPGGSALVGEADHVARILAPYLSRHQANSDAFGDRGR